jgi:methyl-accepting chemotaxis protein
LTSTDTMGVRLAFNRIDTGTRALLVEYKSFVMAELPAVLDLFYAHAGSFPHTAAFFQSSEQMARARSAQLAHWNTILEGRFDDAYAASIQRIGETHHRIGLEPLWYIGGYSVLLCGIIEAIARKAPRPRTPAAIQAIAGTDYKTALQVAIIKATLLDVDHAIAVYLDAGRRERRATLDRLSTAFDTAVSGVIDAVAKTAKELETAAELMTGTARATADQSTAVAAAAQQASSNVRAVAAATEELSTSVKEIGRQVANSADIAGRAVHSAAETSVKVRALSSASQSIGEVLSLISNIASQTNLLALNATIEAARAGEAGKGFAVVAQEVKSLAAQTAKATAEISGQISGIQSSTTDAVAAIGAIGSVIETMSGIATTIAAAVEEQDAATTDIARNVQEAAQGTAEVSANTSGLSHSATSTGSAAAQVTASASELGVQASTLRKVAEDFAAMLRTA